MADYPTPGIPRLPDGSANLSAKAPKLADGTPDLSGVMILSVTIDDPKAYLAPWTMETTLTLMPDTELLEAFCDNQDRILQHNRVDPAPPGPHSPPVRETRP